MDSAAGRAVRKRSGSNSKKRISATPCWIYQAPNKHVERENLIFTLPSLLLLFFLLLSPIFPFSPFFSWHRVLLKRRVGWRIFSFSCSAPGVVRLKHTISFCRFPWFANGNPLSLSPSFCTFNKLIPSSFCVCVLCVFLSLFFFCYSDDGGVLLLAAMLVSEYWLLLPLTHICAEGEKRKLCLCVVCCFFEERGDLQKVSVVLRRYHSSVYHASVCTYIHINKYIYIYCLYIHVRSFEANQPTSFLLPLKRLR